MKKILLAIVVAASVLCLSSCSKKCYCSAKLNGEEIAGKTIDNDSGKACSEHNYRATVLGQSVEFKCRPTF